MLGRSFDIKLQGFKDLSDLRNWLERYDVNVLDIKFSVNAKEDFFLLIYEEED
jgi:hypothetical protein